MPLNQPRVRIPGSCQEEGRAALHFFGKVLCAAPELVFCEWISPSLPKTTAGTVGSLQTPILHPTSDDAFQLLNSGLFFLFLFFSLLLVWFCLFGFFFPFSFSWVSFLCDYLRFGLIVLFCSHDNSVFASHLPLFVAVDAVC